MPGSEPWRRFEAKLDPGGTLFGAVRARRSKITYRAYVQANAKRAARARAATRTAVRPPRGAGWRYDPRPHRLQHTPANGTRRCGPRSLGRRPSGDGPAKASSPG